ncbi:SE-domain-containing protein [Wallemia mellicola]|uniref:Squalene monooxygenase n=1 Tax=Wallemia mellicola TaxID=1708541 RepID=A0A4T0NXH1_9BASI|nr:SE-domain-containing protein [Wallemia mellicola]TIC01359.1 SE-domain-containing protein [Wallemia mellicola]
MDNYDAIIVGAGIAGPPLAAALSKQNRRVLLIERDWSEPDRIVGELLQPGGLNALKELEMSSALENIDSIPVEGYCVIYNKEPVHIPYPFSDLSSKRHQGRSFHHGRFIQGLRELAKQEKAITTVEATVKSLMIDNDVVKGVSTSDGKSYKAPITFIADGCFSNLRKFALKEALPPKTCSWFVGLILHDCELPKKYHGNVILGDNHACVLLYQIGNNDVRILMDVRGDRPSIPKLPDHIKKDILPHLPESVQQPLLNALSDPEQRLRIMPNSYMRPTSRNANTRKGVLLIGDAHNQRHPLTGGGMTCALTDVNTLTKELDGVDLHNWDAVKVCLHNWDWTRRSTAGTVNTLSMALYDLFSGDDDDLKVLRQGCFRYFLQGGDCIDGPVALLSAVRPEPLVLFYHFFAVAFKSISLLYAQSSSNVVFTTFKAIHVLKTACIVLLPTMVMELVPYPQHVLKFLLLVSLFILGLAIHIQSL